MPAKSDNKNSRQTDAKISGHKTKSQPPKSKGPVAANAKSGNQGKRAVTTIDHEEIRGWAEERGAQPSCVRRTGGKGDVGMIRLDFPGYSGKDTLEPISWEDWFSKFDESNLALVYQETTARGKKSNFNKLIGRETAEMRAQGDAKASRRHPERSKSTRKKAA